MKKYTKIDELLRETYDSDQAVKAPEGLTQRIMERIQYVDRPYRFNYQPVINKKGWWIVGLLFSAIIVMAFALPGNGSFMDEIFNTNLINFNLSDILRFNQPLSLDFSLPDYVKYLAIILPLSLLVFYKVEQWMQSRPQPGIRKESK